MALKIILTLIIATQFACSSKSIPDVPIYKDLPFSGKCLEVWTISDTIKLTTKEECQSIKESSLLITPASWAKIKLAWVSACLKAGIKCENDVTTVDEFFKTVQSIIVKTVAPKPPLKK